MMMLLLSTRSVLKRAPWVQVCGRYLHSTRTCTLLSRSDEPAFQGVTEATSRLIYEHARQSQTSVSLKTLMQSGRGEFLNKTYKDNVFRDDDDDDDNKVATEKVLMQVFRCFDFVLCFVVYFFIIHFSFIKFYFFLTLQQMNTGCWIPSTRIAYPIGPSYSRFRTYSPHARHDFCRWSEETLHAIVS